MENSKIAELIEEVKNNARSLKDQVNELVATIEELSKAFYYEHPQYGTQYLKCGYYPYSWEGKKIVLDTSGIGDAPIEKMVTDLIILNKIDSFLEYYTKVALPIHASNGNCREKFYL